MKLLTCSILGAAATAAAAQSPSLTTQTIVGVFARAGVQTQVESIPASTAITAATRIQAAVTGAASNLGVGPGARSQTFVLAASGQASANATTRGEAGTTTQPANVPPPPGPVSFLLAWRGDVRRVQLAMGGNATDGGAASVAVDVGDDGSVEFRQSVDGSPHTFDFALGGLGAVVAKIVVNTHAQPQAAAPRAAYQLDVSIDTSAAGEQPCRFANYGQGCGGLGLGGSDRIVGLTHNIELNVRGGYPNLPVVLMFGERALNVPIPGFAPCLLLLNPLVTVPIQADQNGNMDNTFIVGPGLEGQLLVQALVLRRANNGFELKTSNGARMECGR